MLKIWSFRPPTPSHDFSADITPVRRDRLRVYVELDSKVGETHSRHDSTIVEWVPPSVKAQFGFSARSLRIESGILAALARVFRSNSEANLRRTKCDTECEIGGRGSCFLSYLAHSAWLTREFVTQIRIVNRFLLHLCAAFSRAGNGDSRI